ncbi:hypothetical protein A4H97_18345 [Niastella yeongjuensis]|uniref:Bacteroidetes PKD-like domain-containing protein n=1 Tax=Niastella yeongjuensis TaxID=354355 RepID=A0A1V9DY02_9BACT|nr:PKD-like domain-containing protein [Niastella yeongjuensis]OQP38679.1 hypothetical protein A4H97_18345 [Niastella yeongjuensis]SEO36699.1 PKD-like domain-containing protein [Niastella yeongjuensis]
MKSITTWKWIMPAVLLIHLASCSKHKDDSVAPGTPAVEFNNTVSGEYKVKIGKEITLSAKVTDAVNPVYAWKLNGKIISNNIDCKFTGTEPGENFVTFRVDAENGSMEQQVKLTVVSKLPPQIDMPANLVAYSGKDNRLTATVHYADGAQYAWRLNGVVVSSDSVFVYKPTVTGSNILSLKVWNEDGEDLKSFGLNVLPPPPPGLFFDDGHFRLSTDNSIKRLSVPLGDTLIMAPVLSQIPAPVTLQWAVDGVVQNGTSGEYFQFIPAAKGTYLITATVAGITAKVTVECVAPRGTYFRAANGGSQRIATKSFEFIPAPGQFTDYPDWSTADMARDNIQRSLDGHATEFIALLGAYGGYFITGFDHSVNNVKDNADLSIVGNEFLHWSEPGIVWVSQDENGNGLPDDTWYELKGSESTIPDHPHPETRTRYAITYYKPSGPNQDVMWTDNFGGTGSIDYNQYHSQPYYFPMFINADAYTLTGTCLKSTMAIGALETSEGYAWGYVDNVGDGSRKNFDIDDAIRADGTPANLKYVDFVKVHTAMTGKGAAVGELSTEAGAPYDLNLIK